MFEAFKFGLAVCLGYLINLGFNQIQVSAYQSSLENQNKSLKSENVVCKNQVKEIKGVVEKW